MASLVWHYSVRCALLLVKRAGGGRKKEISEPRLGVRFQPGGLGGGPPTHTFTQPLSSSTLELAYFPTPPMALVYAYYGFYQSVHFCDLSTYVIARL